jgi:hypothetical protein
MSTIETQVAQEQPAVEDENPVTFQIVLKGSDGLIAGSDRLVLVKSPHTHGAYSYWQTEEGTKFYTRDDESVICFAAGGPQASEIAKAIVVRCEPNQTLVPWQNSLKTIAESVPGNSKGDEIIVIRKQQVDVVLLNRNGKDTACREISSALCTGIPATSRFLSQHFWTPTTVRPLRELVLVALHYAAKESPTGVGKGFDVMLLTNGEITWEKYAEDDPRIREVVKRFECQVRSALFPHKAQANPH